MSDTDRAAIVIAAAARVIALTAAMRAANADQGGIGHDAVIMLLQDGAP